MADELDALVNLVGEFVTATYHLLDNSEESGPTDDPVLAVWRPDFKAVSNLLDRCEALPSGSVEYMTAGELLAGNIRAQITALRGQIESLREALSMCDDELYAPAQDCSCHLAPPCHDCVTYGSVREAKAAAEAALEETK